MGLYLNQNIRWKHLCSLHATLSQQLQLEWVAGASVGCHLCSQVFKVLEWCMNRAIGDLAVSLNTTRKTSARYFFAKVTILSMGQPKLQSPPLDRRNLDVLPKGNLPCLHSMWNYAFHLQLSNPEHRILITINLIKNCFDLVLKSSLEDW